MGTALILGAFVGIAAASGAFMNLNFMIIGNTPMRRHTDVKVLPSQP